MPYRSPRVRIAALLFVAAIVGYLAGRSSTSGREPVREAANAAMTATYSPARGWRPVAEAPEIADLPLTQPLAFAPGGNSAAASLVAGQIANVEGAPLPRGFLALLGSPPRAEAVELEGAPAFRYEDLETGPPAGKLTIYAIPSSSPIETVIACYVAAAPRASSTLTACEGLAASMRLSGLAGEASAGGDLAPSAGYAYRINAALERVDALRSALAHRLRAGVPPGALAEAAASLAAGVAEVAKSLDTVQPPPAAEWTQASLLRSLGSLRDAYRALAAAVRGSTQSAYAAALVQLHSAEAQVDGALSDFGLLGYQ